MEMNRVVIADMPLDERPRERMMRGGAAVLSDAELLAILIQPGLRGKSSIDLAREALAGGLLAFARKEWIPGKKIGSLGAARVARIGAALELGRRIAGLTAATREEICDVELLAPGLISRYAHHVQERLGAVYLDSRRRVIREREIYIGTLNSATVSPRDVLRCALEEHAASVVVFHNHPSGDPSPSADDFVFTRKIVEAGKVMGIEILDHLIVASSQFVSLKKRGAM
jgi:DNA repair protein RadC